MTDVALKEHLERQIQNLRDYVDTKDVAAHRALDLATKGLHDRFEQVNQFREQVLQERGVFVRRELLDTIYERLTRLELVGSNLAGRWAGVALMAALIGGTLGAMASHWLGMR